ncbi:hypothetical protein GUITHDRAFT_138820 [Guillardia theta CCMP2712]|uniref:Glycosyltransferase 2-like domain-containing protein n=1 Tax=Guillardia theta (strain CCMP2712) TaxID=905079 RepID=L1JAP1_GUITC|nr:hypothetical protein GUITHDRAFT_138820 [Guillardia theta CCMP2712]EKX45596.1 hypothetical protein GUITHDRAFT_138820 [Guillardia theta CCMP2712]|eukprot:XP_005832576.1 hypothetical protein GUITHDRAFT_138820 [Guillardia theta CCMP2712]
MASVSVVVFSKSRPFQLSEYLRTLVKHAAGVELDITVLVKVEEEYREGYEQVQRAHPRAKFVEEESFEQQLRGILHGARSSVMFGVDDVLFCSSLPLAHALLEMMKMFAECGDLYDIGHPNRLEVNGNKIYKEGFTLWYERQKGSQEQGKVVEEMCGGRD